MVLRFYVQEHSKAQPAVVLVLKRLRRRGNSIKSHQTDWEKPVIEPVLQDIGLSPTPQRLLTGRFIPVAECFFLKCTLENISTVNPLYTDHVCSKLSLALK